MDLCLCVVQANGVATLKELTLLNNLARWLEVDGTRFRSMVEKILPVCMHEVEDIEVILDISPDKSKNQTRRQLNEEFRKWNARVTNFDSKIQVQAGHMLKLITDARSKYIG